MKVLVVDDQPEVLAQIRKAVEAAQGPDGIPYNVEAMTDHQEALDKLEKERFDVVITDMVMGAGEEDGLTILRRLTDKSPITIVLTAYPSIPNCVESMRAGAWDYLEKIPEDGGDPYDNLLSSLKMAVCERLAKPEAGRYNPDAKWIHEHMADLMEKYPGRVVAVLDGQVAGEGESFDEVAKRVKQEHPVAQPTIISIPDTDIEAIE